MHVVTFTEPVVIAREKKIAPGSYLCDNANAGQWLSRYSGAVRVEGVRALPPWKPGVRTLCVVRPGGLGDLIMLTPILRAVKRQGTHVTVCAHPWNAAVLRGLPYVDQVVDYPLPQWQWEDFEAIVALEDVLEHEPRPAEVHALDSMLRVFPGLAVSAEDRRPDYQMLDGETTAALAAWGRPERKKGALIVGVQLEASSAIRTYPRMRELLNLLVARGHGVRLFAEAGKHRIEHPFKLRMHNLAAGEPIGLSACGHAQAGRAPTFRESVALACDCDVLVAPDSSMVHAAGALGIPCIALYGSFPAKVRTAYYPSVKALEGKGRCAGCCWHGRLGRWPKWGDCNANGFCTVLATITPGEIVARVEGVK